MSCYRTIFALALLCLVASQGPRACAVDVVKTNPMKVYAHYMPWFETPATLGGTNWGFHWQFNNRNPNIVDATGKRQIASHYYPKIGPYASSDPDVIEYHMLLMKLSGIDGVLLDWYGVQGTNGDLNRLLNNSNAIVSKTGTFDLDFGVVLEDRYSANLGQAQANVAYLRDHYFNKSNYIRVNPSKGPLLGVFGPITFQQESQWTQILSSAGEPVDFTTLWYESADAGVNADGEYPWIYEDANLDNHLTHQSNYYRFRAPNLGTAGGVAYPGFNDYYQEGGVGNVVQFEIPHNNGQTLDQVLNLVNTFKTQIDFLQLATFNDFGEGTMFEPTVETGFDYLKRIQQFTGVPYGEAELQLVYRLYNARKEYANNPAIEMNLDQVSILLNNLDIAGATTLLNSTSRPGDFNSDGLVDSNDYGVWRSSFGTSTILYGTSEDGNHDGAINAADYVVWRNDLSAAKGAGTYTPTVPEPAAGAMIALALAMFYWPRLARQSQTP